MTLAQFKSSVNSESPPPVNKMLLALWYDAKGAWQRAHEIIQDIETKDAAWIHAYLHRKEGDHSNAGYWYHRAGQALPSGTTEMEWEMMAAHFLQKNM